MFGFGDDSEQAQAHQQVYGGDDQNKAECVLTYAESALTRAGGRASLEILDAR